MVDIIIRATHELIKEEFNFAIAIKDVALSSTYYYKIFYKIYYKIYYKIIIRVK